MNQKLISKVIEQGIKRYDRAIVGRTKAGELWASDCRAAFLVDETCPLVADRSKTPDLEPGTCWNFRSNKNNYKGEIEPFTNLLAEGAEPLSLNELTPTKWLLKGRWGGYREPEALAALFWRPDSIRTYVQAKYLDCLGDDFYGSFRQGKPYGNIFVYEAGSKLVAIISPVRPQQSDEGILPGSEPKAEPAA